MQDRYITSDLHFNHKNLLKYHSDSRPFETVEEMNEQLISRWNSRVKKQDIIYILGDISFASIQKTKEFLEQLNGQKHLIFGNHDRKLRSYEIRKFFESTSDYKEIKYNNQQIVMMHFPIVSWHRKRYGSYMLHGHSHGKPLPYEHPRLFDVGVDGNNCYPYHLDEVIDIIKKRDNE